MTTFSQNSTVKDILDLSDNNVTSLPSNYITRSPTIASTEIIANEEIPIIDFSLLISKTPGERAKIIQQLGQACEHWGCFMVVNHGLPEDLITSTIEAFAAFFDQTAEQKQVFKGKQVFDPIVYGTSFDPMAKGTSYWRDFLRIVASPVFNCPEQPHNFRLSSEEFAGRTREILKELIRGISESLDLEENYMEEFFDLKSCHQVLVGNLYPPCPQPELALGLPPHSDSGILNLLMQNSSFPGLQVMHNGKWIPLQPIPNSFFIFAADFLEIFSNGKYKSVLHRCMVDSKSTRISVLSLIGPPMEGVVVAPAPKLIQRQNMPAAFRGITYKEYVKLHRTNQLNKSSLAAIRL